VVGIVQNGVRVTPPPHPEWIGILDKLRFDPTNCPVFPVNGQALLNLEESSDSFTLY
jgi:hypothetical protein